LRICKLSSDRYAQWDSFILNHQDATFFHTIKWMKILRDYGFGGPFYLLLEDSGDIIGVLPLYFVDIFPVGRGLTSLSDCNGPLLQNVKGHKDYFVRLLQRLEEEAEKHNVSFSKLRLQASSPSNSFMPNRYVKYTEYCTFVLDLSEGTERIFKDRIHKKTRTSIRKAVKLGVEVNKDLPSVETYWKLYKNTMVRSKGILNEKRIKLFRLIWKELTPKKEFVTLTAMFEGEPIGGIMAFLFRDKVHVWYNSSLSQFLYLNPNEFLYWKLAEEVVNKGYRYLDFGPTPLQASDGHHFFKARFGGSMIPFNDYAYFRSRLRCLLIERGLLQLAKKLNVRKKLPQAILQKMGRRMIF